MDFGFGPGEGLGIFVIGLYEGIDVPPESLSGDFMRDYKAF